MSGYGALFPAAQQWFDTLGNPLSSGTLTFYSAGTTTPKNVYSDYNLNNSLGNVVTLDSAGTSTIFGSGAYKVVVKTSSGATVKTQDNIYLLGGFSYDSTTGIVNIAGTNNYFTMGSSGLLRPVRLQYATATNGGTTVISQPTTHLILDNAGIAGHTVTLPTPYGENHTIKVVASTGAIAAITFNGGTTGNAPASLAAGKSVEFIYRTSGTKWWALN